MSEKNEKLKLRLRPVDPQSFSDLGYLWGVLSRRMDEPDSNISHVALPPWAQHVAFIRSAPYKAHYIVFEEQHGNCVGVCYVDRLSNIGVYVEKPWRRRGVGRWMVGELIKSFPKPLWANINPRNLPSQNLFADAGFVLHEVDDKQLTMKLMDEVERVDDGAEKEEA